MTNPIRIKRSTGNTAPTTLNNAELAYVEGTDILYYGKGISSGTTAASIVAVAGLGAYVNLTGTQTITGAKTFSSNITGSVTGNAGTATLLQNARNFSITGDITAPSISFTGGADVALAATLANSGVTAGTYTKLTVDAKGRVTVGATARLDELAAPTAAVSMNSQRLTTLATPIAAMDAATKQYVDDLAQGLQVKTPVRVATTASITLSGLQTIDGVSVASGDRVLVKDQITAATNGIYLANASTWTRSTDLDTWAEAIGAYVFVQNGTVNANTSWVTQVMAGGTIDVTAMPWAQFSSVSTYSAGNGLLLTGTSFSVLADGTSLSVSGSGVRISATYAGQNTITTLGTIATGTWQGTAVGVAYGGTGVSSFTVNSLLKSGSTTTGNLTVATPVSSTGTAGDYLDSNSLIDGGSF